MTGEEEVKVGKSSFAVLCLPATGGRVRSVLMEDKERTKQQKAATAKNQLRGNPHSHAMEMTARNLHPNSKADGKNCDCSSNRNGGDTTEITVPLSPLGKRFLPIEGDNLYRLRDRKFLLEDKKRLCAWALGIALLGILLMILHTELCPVIYLPSSVYAFTITCMISLSTGCLLFLIVAFHYKDIRLFTIDHNQVDWRIAMTSQRLLGISLELVVCAIHPIAIYWGPEMGTPGLAVDSAQGGQAGTQGNFSSRPLCSSIRNSDLLDLVPLLSCLMFLRLYLVHRAIHLHSKVLLNVSYRSIGSLNNINFTFRFVLKVLMNKYPGRTLLVFIVFLWADPGGNGRHAHGALAHRHYIPHRGLRGRVPQNLVREDGVPVHRSHGRGLHRHVSGGRGQVARAEQRGEACALLHDGHPDLQTAPSCCGQRAEGVLAHAPRQLQEAEPRRAPATAEEPAGGHPQVSAPAAEPEEASGLRQRNGGPAQNADDHV
ncbi:uncharacterized protein kcnn4 isoform X3 [Anguilla anguilla]|uniref:uncharacterized protein kcnn4 isoform X3 n=1 Tax=Anguilla anguilla TaxID=7936 RepID=UPI0015A8EA79|nr:uncharacterized protein kcnn4 isoform X3 [Anguilla anguilla]